MVLQRHPNQQADQGAEPLESQIATEKRQYRILYAIGPGDVVGQGRDQLEGKEPAFQLGMSFSQQFLDACDAAGISAHVISRHGRKDKVQCGRHLLENRPQSRLCFAGGIKHYIGILMYALSLLAQAIRDRAEVVIVDSGTTRWFVLSLLGLFGIPSIAVLHSALWPVGFPPERRIDRMTNGLDGWFFRHVAAASLCVSPALERQVELIARKPKGPIFQFRPQYREEFMRGVPAVRLPFRPFNVLFLGRVEEYKGVFMILAMAERLEQESPGGFKWRIFGAGSAADRLQAEIQERMLGGIVHAGTMLPNEQSAQETLGWAHVMIVPTTSEFCEGLAMTAAESVLAGRPVVLSDVVPAWEVLGDAKVKCQTNSVDSFVDALKELARDPAYYEDCRRATAEIQSQFYDRQQGLGNVIIRAIETLG